DDLAARAEFHAPAPRRAARLGPALVAHEDQLGLQVQRPERRAQLHPLRPPGLAAEADLQAGGPRERAGGAAHRRARVVAVVAGAEVEEEFRPGPGAEDEVGL